MRRQRSAGAVDDLELDLRGRRGDLTDAGVDDLIAAVAVVRQLREIGWRGLLQADLPRGHERQGAL